MTTATFLLVAGGPLAAGLTLAWTTPWRRGRERMLAGAQERQIVVRAGYDPAEVHVDAGIPIRLVFRRQESSACSERVVFPDLGISATLPAFKDTAVVLDIPEAGSYPFTCEMEMLHGLLVVEPLASRDPSEVAVATCAEHATGSPIRAGETVR